MSRNYYFRDGDGNQLIEIADGDFFTDGIQSGYSLGAIAVEFLDADGVTPVTPTGGTVTFLSSPIGEQWHEPSNGNGVINAVDVSPTPNYTMPTFNGPVIKSRMTLDSITGATYVRAYHWRDE